MKTQMEHFRQLLLHAAGIGTTGAGLAACAEHFVQELKKAEEDLYAAFRVEVFGKAHDRLVERHIRQTQSDCIYLMDLLAQRVNVPEALQSMRQAGLTCLESVLSYIEQYHSVYFNVRAVVPQAYFLNATEHLKAQAPVLQAALKKKKVEIGLQNIICSGLSEFTLLQNCSYEQLIYMKHLLQSLLTLCKEAEETDFTEMLLEQLLYLRFNPPAFTRYYKAKIAGELSLLYTIEAQSDHLWTHKKQLKAQQERASVCYESYNLSTRLELMEYLKAELQYLERKGIRGMAPPGPVNFQHRLEAGYRVKLAISADVLAYLVRLLIEVNVITANPRTQLMAFLARSCETAGIGMSYLSANSLNTKYKQVVQNTAIAVRSILVKMLKRLDAEFRIN